MRKVKRGISLLLAALMALGCMSALPLSGVAAADQAIPTGNSVQAAEDAQAGLIVSFSKSVSDRKIENIVEAEEAEIVSIDTLGAQKLATVSVEEDVVATAAALADQSAVKAVQPNYRYETSGDDPFIGGENSAFHQYQFSSTNAMAAWEELESGAHGKTRVAVIDTGIDLHHEDLQKNVIRQDGKYANFSFGDLNMIEDDTDEEDGHGTHVSGIIAATYGNDIGGSGIASGHENNLVELMTVSASPDGIGLYTIDIVKAIAYAVEHGARVINMSFGSSIRDFVMEAAIKDAYYNDGVAFVAASGNEDSEDFSTPSDMKEVLSVNATNAFDQPTYYSNYGPEKDVAAPGNNVWSTLPGDNYGIMSGTSMASPVAAGVAALVLDANPNLTPAQVYNIMCASAKRAEGAQTIYDESAACGIVDALAAVRAAKAAGESVPVEDVCFKTEAITISQKEIYGAEAIVLPATSLAPVSWSIADTDIATIDALSGFITALQPGETTITATAGDKSQSQKLIVTATEDVTQMSVKGIPEDGVMGVGEMTFLTVTLKPDNATFTDWYLKSDQEQIVAVSDGALIAKKPGKAHITVETWDGALQEEFDITVKNLPVEIVFSDTTRWLSVGETYTFLAKSVDEEGADDVAYGTLTYSSSNKKVFTVDETTGLVTAVAPGKAFVIARNEDVGDMAAVPLMVAKKDYKGSDYALKQSKVSKNSVTLTWNKVPVASGYRIEYKAKAGDTWKTLKTLAASKTAYTHTGRKSGMIYYYRVKALYQKGGKSGAFSYSDTLVAKTLALYNLKQSAKTSRSVTLKWSKVPAASGYQIQYRAASGAAWKTIKTVSAKTLTFKHSGLKAGTTGNWRVRAFVKTGSSVQYFNYSFVVKAKSAT